MACSTCTRWMVWNESDIDQTFYYYDCNDGTTLLSTIVGDGQFYSVCGCQASGSYATSNDVYIEDGGTGYINYNGILLSPCETTPEPSITLTPFPTRTPNHTPTPTPTPTITPTLNNCCSQWTYYFSGYTSAVNIFYQNCENTLATTQVFGYDGMVPLVFGCVYPGTTPFFGDTQWGGELVNNYICCEPPTPIICGSGVTTGQYYYFDCCGNSVTGNTAGITVVFDYTKGNGGVTKLNTPASVSCPSPTPTRTQTPTPTVTPTLTVTPTNTVTPTVTPTQSPNPKNNEAYTVINECRVLTQFDMGIECYPIKQPSSPLANDGILAVRVTGGTSPYTFLWEDNSRTQMLVGVEAGSYQVTVTDFYLDYTATTICSLFAPSPTPTNTTTPTPTVTPTPVYPNLCLIYIGQTVSYGPIQFTPSGYQNGKPTWSGTYNSTTLTIIWSITKSIWEIQGWLPITAKPISTNTTNIPNSNWIMTGQDSQNPTLSMTQGTCPAYLPLRSVATIANSTCSGTQNCNGSISLLSSYGVAPYQYSINNGVTFQTSGIFNGLCPNTYTIITKDSVNTQISTISNVGFDSNPINYVIKAQLINTQLITAGDEIANWEVNITPPLPIGTTINFTLTINSTQSVNSPGNGIISSSTNVKKNNVLQTPPTPTSLTQTFDRPNCSPSQTTQRNVSEVYNLSMTNGDVITGTSTSLLVITDGQVGINSCSTTLVQDILISTSSPIISNCTCCSVSNNPDPQGIVGHTLQGTTSITCSSSVVPPTTINGIVVTDTYIGDVQTYPDPFSSCGGLVTTPANSIYLGSIGSFSYTMNFSQSVNDIIIFITATDGYNSYGGENFVITTNTGIPIITSPYNCYTTITGNEIISGIGVPLTSTDGGGGKFVIHNNSSSYTSLTITGDGGSNGSLLAICANSVIPTSPSTSPSQTPTHTPTPTPTPSSKMWQIITCTSSCKPIVGQCFCLNPAIITVYTSFAVTDITSGGTLIYTNSTLTTPFVGLFQKNGSIWYSNGDVNEECVVGGTC